MGHYARWDAVNLKVSGARLDPIHEHHGAGGRAAGRPSLSAAAGSLADECGVDVEVVEAVTDAVADGG